MPRVRIALPAFDKITKHYAKIDIANLFQVELNFNIVFLLFYDIVKYEIGVDARGVKGGGL
jgi:hypothetical protein